MRKLNYSSDELVMVSAIQHYSFCPRQYALIHMEQVFDENVYTLRGRAVHSRVDEPDSFMLGVVRVEYSLPLFSENLGLTGKADVVEIYEDGRIYPVEYKHGPKRAKEHDDLQLAAQVVCLEEMTGKTINFGAIYHHTSRRRREVKITDSLRNNVVEIVEKIRLVMRSGKLPPPVYDQRCRNCSLVDACQPDLVVAKEKISYFLQTLFEDVTK